VEETSGIADIISKFNLDNIPDENNEWLGKFCQKLWQDALHEKVQRLSMHQRWIDLHEKFRGRKSSKKSAFPHISANYIFKTIYSFTAILTEKYPKAEVQTNDNIPPEIVRALNEDIKTTWQEEELQELLFSSVQNMNIYGTTVEKFIFDVEKNISRVILRDVFQFFPAPGYTRGTLELPYCCDAYFLHTWKIRDKFEIPENIHIPADANEQLFGKQRETVRGGEVKYTALSNLPSNYAETSSGDSRGRGLHNQALVVEIWIRDKAIETIPIFQQGQATYNDGTPVFDDNNRPVMQKIKVDERQREKYPGGVRKITFVPGMVTSTWNHGVVDDRGNPNINWELVNVRKQVLLETGIPVPASDPNTGQPIIDPNTGQPIMTSMPVDEEKAESMALDTIKNTWLFSRFPFSVVPSMVDTSQWWGFSIIEQIEELVGAAESVLQKYFAFLQRCMFPIFINPIESGVPNSAITNAPGLILNPILAAAAGMGYINPPVPPQGLLDFIQFIYFQVDMLSLSPEVTQGRRPKGVSAASAMIALMDKAATLFQPQIWAVDKIIRNRGRAHISMVQNFGTESKPIRVDKEYVRFIGINLQAAFKYVVESGSSAPITKQGRRTQFIELFRVGAMDVHSLLEQLEIPAIVIERVLEAFSVPGALKILINAGLPQEVAQQVYALVLQNPGIGGQSGAGKPGEGTQTTQPTGPNPGASESAKGLYKQMSTQG